MKYRKLRIAWSIACGILCLLLIALWVRSYWWVTNIQVLSIAGRNYQLVLGRGTADLYSVRVSAFPAGMWASDFSHYYYTDLDYAGQDEPQFDFAANEFTPGDITVRAPYWFSVVLTSMIAASPWLPCRFSLRTLLIGTTVVAVILGAVVYTVN